MPPPLLIDLDQVDLSEVAFSRSDIYERYLPHRYEFTLLSGVCMHDAEGLRIVAFADLTPGDWWVRGHVPGRPLLPGVLMLEMAAHTAALQAKLAGGVDGFIGFGGVDECKFRETVVPPDRLYILAVGHEQRPRRIVSRTQGVAHGKMIFEAKITGLIV